MVIYEEGRLIVIDYSSPCLRNRNISIAKSGLLWPAAEQHNDAFVVLHFLGLVNVASEEE